MVSCWSARSLEPVLRFGLARTREARPMGEDQRAYSACDHCGSGPIDGAIFGIGSPVMAPRQLRLLASYLTEPSSADD